MSNVLTTDPKIICPNCKTEIRLTESLAAPLIAATRQQYEQQLLHKDEEVATREQSVREKEKQLLDARRTLDDQSQIKSPRSSGPSATVSSPRNPRKQNLRVRQS